MKRATIEKEPGETPLQAIERFRTEAELASTVPLAYAGRLDPMASGKLLVLIGDECKRQKEYHSLDKEYEFEVLFGFSSDTGDTLGKAVRSATNTPTETDIIALSEKLLGEVALPYPIFSSKTVNGKPLFLWTLEGRLHEIEVPTATTHIFSLSYLSSRTATAAEIQADIHKRILRITPVTAESKKLGEDFRRVPILALWDELLGTNPDEQFFIARFKTVCSSGTYIRSLAPHMAQVLGTTGLAYSIHRTKIGRYFPIPCTNTGIWVRNYR